MYVSKGMIILMDERVIGTAIFSAGNPPQNYQSVNRYMVIPAKDSKRLPTTQLATSLISELLTDYCYGIAVSVLAQFLISSLIFT